MYIYDCWTENSLTVEKKLAHVQALLIYQTIRVFDVDIRLRSNAEAAMPTLEA